MTTPIRLQLSRAKGFRLAAASVAANGLPAVNVARPTRWGNPYVVGPGMPAAEAVAAFREAWALILGNPSRAPAARRDLAELRGRNLACWCKSGEPCHADVLLELANAEVAG